MDAGLPGNTSTLIALAYALGAAAIFTVVFASAKFVGSNADPVQVVFMRYAGALALLGQFCQIKAFDLADAVIIVPISCASIPMAAGFGYLAFQQDLGPVQAFAAMLVIAGGVLLARLPARHRCRLKQFQAMQGVKDVEFCRGRC